MEFLWALAQSLIVSLTTSGIRRFLNRFPFKWLHKIVINKRIKMMERDGPFEEVLTKWEKRFDEFAQEMVEDFKEWGDNNEDVLLENAKRLKELDLPQVEGKTQSIRFELDFSQVLRERVGYEITSQENAKFHRDIPIPFIRWKPHDPKL